jgi:hypothetical protein
LFQRKANGRRNGQHPIAMNTFQVYLTDQGGHSWFEPLLAETPAQLLAKLRERLARQRLREARVEHQGHVLFTLER